MKDNVHPTWYPNAKVTCTCGASFETGSVKPEIKVEICSNCHPFFTGEMRFVDTQGRIEKFKAKQDAAKGYVKKGQRNQDKDEKPRSLKEMLQKK